MPDFSVTPQNLTTGSGEMRQSADEATAGLASARLSAESAGSGFPADLTAAFDGSNTAFRHWDERIKSLLAATSANLNSAGLDYRSVDECYVSVFNPGQDRPRSDLPTPG